jgi:Carboxypeptidase regulatory-like domain/TonB dependent receptor
LEGATTPRESVTSASDSYSRENLTMTRTKVASFLVLIVSLLTPAFLSGQEVASLTGSVTDTTGAVVPGASVKLVDTRTNAAVTTKTDTVGGYVLSRLLPGPGYQLTVTKDGFETVVISGVYLAVATTHTQNVQLKLGTVSQTVEVNGAGSAVSLDTTDTSVSTDFDMNLVHELPVQLRDNPAALMILQPGVVDVGQGSSSDSNGSRAGAVTGARIDQNNVTLDGLDVNDFGTGLAFYVNGNAPVDSVQEFRGESANQLTAEGRGSGAQVQMTTKSGTNTWHGAAYEYNRVTALEANTYFNNLSGLPRTPLIRNQFGADLGGPAIKNKLFFFFDYNGRRDDAAVSVENIVPLDNWLNGEVGYINDGVGCTSASRANTTPNCVTYLTPTQLSTPAGPCLSNGTTGTPVPCDPLAIGPNSNLLTFINGRYPHANDLGVGDGINTGGFRFNAPAHLIENDYVSRIDYNISTNMKLFGRVSILRQYTDDDINFPAPIQFPGDPTTHQIQDTTYAYVIGHTWTISNDKVNQLVYGETRQRLNFPTLFNPSTYIEYQVFGNITSPYSSQASQGRVVPIPVYKDDFTYTRGAHTFQVGGQFKPIKDEGYTVFDLDIVDLGIGGNLNALPASQQPSNILQPGPNDPSGVATTAWNDSFPFSLGRFSNVVVNTNNTRNLQPLPPGSKFQLNSRFYETEAYVQDTWRVRSDLTVNYGLRYQYYSVPYEMNGLEALANQGFNQFFLPRVQAGQQGSAGPFEPVSFFLAGKANNEPGYYQPNWHDFAPRFGVAYNPSFTDGFLGKLLGDRKTVIRAGAGVVFDHSITSALAFFQEELSGIFQNSNGTPGNSLATDPRFTATNTLPPGVVQPTPPTNPFTPFIVNGIGVGEASDSDTYSTDPNLKTPYSETISFGIQRELPGHFQFDATYFGRFGRRLLAQADAGQVVNFTDTTPGSGQTLNQAFSALETQIRGGATTVTPQPFFENQTVGGTAECQSLGAPNCTALLAFGNQSSGGNLGSNTSFLQTGNLASIVFTNAAFGELAALAVPGYTGLIPGVGMNPQYGLNIYQTNKGASDYNGLLTSLHRKLANGLQFDLNYTYSHSIDNTSVNANNFSGEAANFSGGILCDANNPRLCRAYSEFDITHIISADGIYDLPIGRGKHFGSAMPSWLNQVIGGWQFAGIDSWHTGFAFTPVANAEPISVNNNVPPIFDGDYSALKTHIHNVNGSIQLFANQANAIAAFTAPTGLQAGSRNILRGPRYSDVDLSLNKHFPIHERLGVEFRAEAYNVFNHTNFDLPGTLSPGTIGTADITNPGQFGVITTTSDSREMQLSLRIEF